ncbi:MAG: winged helix-turn-helix domain-containing protein, partial [Acidobacteriota bacterium]
MSTINPLENCLEGIYKFGAFSFDINNSVLQNESFVIHLQKKQFDILHLLVLNTGAVVSKEEFFRLIWPGQDVEESNLTMQIHLLRRIIETDIRNPSYILTVPGEGYTMAGDVTFTPKIEGSASIAEDPGLETTPIKSRRFPRINIDRLAAVVASIALLLTLVYFLRPESKPNLARAVPLTSLVGSERYPAISPDGNFTAFTWDGDQLKNDDIYIQQTSVSTLLRITTDPASDIQPTWSRDGQYLAFLRGERNIGEQYRLIIVPVFGGREREVAKVSGGLDWSPDGRYLAVTRITDARG